MKRFFDIIVSALAIVLLAPLWVVAAALVKCTSRGQVFFRQERIGRRFKPFHIYKFRTMVQDATKNGSLVTFGADPRITPVGHFLRATKIDELPQLINVLMGDMSLVGPRPEVRKYVEMFRDDYAEVLRVRPGITDPASIKYRNEAEILGRARSGTRVRRANPPGKNPPGQGLCQEFLALARRSDYPKDSTRRRLAECV